MGLRYNDWGMGQVVKGRFYGQPGGGDRNLQLIETVQGDT
ncbi:MAG: hypothetical protein H6Q51_400 [Deltaproteobacteria bacterium]|nr:hypothetical protein [Deltaproteobacteria bacterium]